MNKAIGYIRVSTDKETQANSLLVQPETIKGYAAANGLSIVKIVQDEESAYKVPFFERPGGQEVLAAIQAGKVTHIIGAKLDRIFRNTQDGLATDEWLKKKRISLHVIDSGGTMKTDTAMGYLFFTMALAIATFEPMRISERTRQALGVMRAAGKKVGTIPLGYREENGQLVEVPEEMEIVNEILLREGRGETMKGIANILNARLVPTKQGGTWHASTIRAIVKRKV